MGPSQQVKIQFWQLILLAGLIHLKGCGKEFLVITPNGELNEAALATYDGVDALLIGAYSMLDRVSQDFGWGAASSGWLYGSIRGLEVNKGTDAGDSYLLPVIQNFSEKPTHHYLNEKW
jgi:hypothetical protein